MSGGNRERSKRPLYGSAFNLTTILLVAIVLVLTISGSSHEDDVCAISAFFNPLQYSTRVANFVHARTWSKRQGLRMVVVELAFGEAPFVISEFPGFANDPITEFVQVRTSSRNVLWQKEALLNLALDHLNVSARFQNCTKIVWLDSDVILEDGWLEATSKMLDRVVVGQPYTHVIRLPKGVFSPFGYWSEPRMERMGYGIAEGQPQLSFARKYGNGTGGHTGFAWAARREALMETKLYDKAIVGGFDALFAYALGDPRCETRLNKAMSADFERYADKARSVFGTTIGFPKNRMVKAATYWHGDNKDRNYQDRHLILLRYNFNPNRDVRPGVDGVLEWAEESCCYLQRAVREMFQQRQEDGPGSGTVSLDSEKELRCKEECSPSCDAAR